MMKLGRALMMSAAILTTAIPAGVAPQLAVAAEADPSAAVADLIEAAVAALGPNPSEEAVQAAVEGAIADSGVTDEAVLAAAVADVVANGTISVEVALNASASISPTLANSVAAAPTVVAAAAEQGVNLQTALNNAVNTQTAALNNPPGDNNNPADNNTNNDNGAPAIRDPCAGVVADYC